MATFSIQALGPVADLSGFAPVRALLGSAATILESVNGARQNRQVCGRLGDLTREILKTVHHELAHSSDLEPEIGSALKHLASCLEDVVRFIERLQTDGIVSRMASSTSDEKQIRAEVLKATTSFQITCTISAQRRLDKMQQEHTSRQQEILQILVSQDVQYRSTDSGVTIRPRPPAAAPVLLGRDTELHSVVGQVTSSSPSASPARIAILGGGGMGKSTLALAVLQHRDIVSKFGDYRFFIPCDSAESASAVVSEMASHLSIYGDKLRKQLLKALGERPMIIVLDNFETPWEDPARRLEIEELLGALCAIDTLTLIVTLRGSERPLGTTWTTPTLDPLQSLNTETALQIISHTAPLAAINAESDDIQELLRLLDGVPLAIALAAALINNDGVVDVLHRLKAEGTSALHAVSCQRQGRLSSLDASIRVSLGSARVRATSGAFELLQLLALLPNGVPDSFAHPQFPNFRKCASALKSALLAYSSDGGTVRVLCPIRLYIRQYHPAPYTLVAPLKEHYVSLADFCANLAHSSKDIKPVLVQLLPEWANVESLCGYLMDDRAGGDGDSDWPAYTVSQFDALLRFTDANPSVLLQRAGELIKTPAYRVRHLLTQAARAAYTSRYLEFSQAALEIAQSIDDPALEAEAWFCFADSQDLNLRIPSMNEALRLYRVVGDRTREAACLLSLARTCELLGQHSDVLNALKEVAPLLQSDGNASLLMRCHTQMANTSLWLGDLQQATEALDRAMELFPLVETSFRLQDVVWMRFTIAELRGDTDEVQRYLIEYRRIQAVVRQSPQRLAFVDGHIAQVLSRIGDMVRARGLLDSASSTSGLSQYYSIGLSLFDADLCRYEGDFGLARKTAVDVRKAAEKGGYQEVRSECLTLMGDIALDEAEECSLADRLGRESLANEALLSYIPQLIQASRSGETPRTIRLIAALGRAFFVGREYETARVVLRWHVVWARKTGICQFLAQSLVALAELYEETAAPESVTDAAWTTADREVRRVKTASLRAKCERRLGYSKQ